MFWIGVQDSEITLEVGEVGTPSQDSEIAHQIEKCDCPLGYAGLSCEVIAFGCNIWQGRAFKCWKVVIRCVKFYKCITQLSVGQIL